MNIAPRLFLCFYFLIGLISLAGCSSSSAESSKTVSNGESEASSAETITFTLAHSTVTIEHSNMEISDQCPKVFLFDKQDKLIDQKSLCDVNIEGYRAFDARKDFAFIDFQEYRMYGDSLHYNIDLALLQGSAFIAECVLPITREELGSSTCKKQMP